MIPKIIHYCWFGGKEKPQSVVDYIQIWKERNPDYTIKEWNESNFDYKSIPFTYEAYLSGKFAFVSDVARLYALYEEGGVYLDTDILLLKGFDSFLNHSSFIGKETPCQLSTAVIGAERGTEWIKFFLETYKTKHFINFKGRLNKTPNTVLLTAMYNNTFENLTKNLSLYDVDVFCAKGLHSGQELITDRTVAVHKFSATWQSPFTFSTRIKHIKALIQSKL